ncbi:MAG: hypothetical protein ABEH90_00960 [Halolamina sp.]
MTMRDGGPSLQTDRAAQSSTIGIVLILGITLMGTGLVIGYGTQAIGDTQDVTTLSKAEHSMTQLDSQAAIVALGESVVQRVNLGSSGDGAFSADSDAGWIRVVHRNATGDGTNETLYNASLGVVKYQRDDTTVAYQGGGVWRRSDNGSVMLSQPEFNYRGSTLTLPVIRVTNDNSAAGETTAIIRRADDSRRVFPNSSDSYDDGSPYMNPITNGTVEVTVKSDYYQGWADFFRSRTTGNVSVNHTTEQATVELLTFGTVGDFELANALDDDGMSTRGQAEGHSLTEFNTSFQKDSGTLNNLYVSFYAEEDNHRFEYIVHVPDGTNCNGGVDSSDTLEYYVFYRNLNTGDQHEWNNQSMSADSGPIRLECGSTDELIVNITSDVNATYEETSISDEGTYYDWSGSVASSATFGHSGDDGETTTFEPTNNTTSRHLARHYIALLGDDFTLNARTGTGARGGSQIDYDSSGGTIDYETGGDTYITYLHVTENDIEVELE